MSRAEQRTVAPEDLKIAVRHACGSLEDCREVSRSHIWDHDVGAIDDASPSRAREQRPKQVIMDGIGRDGGDRIAAHEVTRPMGTEEHVAIGLELFQARLAIPVRASAVAVPFLPIEAYRGIATTTPGSAKS